MITFSIIKKSQLEGAQRLDAEYYQPDYFIDFTKGNWQPVSIFLKKCQYGLSQEMNDDKAGYPMFKMDDINNAFLFEDEVRYANISEKVAKDFILKENDVLFNRVNSEELVGRTGIYKIEDFPSVFASYLIRMKLKDDAEVLPDYLNIFLNSKYGIKQIKKFSRRAVNQANVNAEELKQFKIAVLAKEIQKEIENISNESWNNFQLSKNLYRQAENQLLDNLELKDFNVDKNLFSIINFSDVRNAGRMDAEYFQPKYEKLISKMKSQNLKLLSEVIENVPAKFNPLTEPDKLFKYVELSNIDSSVGIIDGFSETSGREAPGRAKRILKKGDVLVSSVEGSLGKVALVDKEQEDHLASTGFFQFRSEDILPEVILVLAKSIILQMQLEQQCAGTILTAVPKEAINNIYVPILEKPTQQKIADLVRRSHEARKKAKELLDEAKRKVEEMIEKGGENS